MSAIGVVTAISNPALEAVVVEALASRSDEVAVVRRCVELADVLAVAASGLARVIIVGDGLTGLDSDIVATIASYGVTPVAMCEEGARWPAAMRFPVVIESHRSSVDIAEGIVLAAQGTHTVAPAPPPVPVAPRPRGRVVAVWGPAGAPGRSTVALAMADEAARLGAASILIDADVYGGAIATMLGLLDESPGIAAACRSAAAGTLDVAGLARTCLQVSPAMRVLTGISRTDRWPELQPQALSTVVATARELAPVTIIDCGFAIEQDEELAYDTFAPRRNGATITALEEADAVVLVSGCDPVSVARAIRSVQELGELLPGVVPIVVVNKVRSGTMHREAGAELAETFGRFAGVAVHTMLPLDQKSCDTALLRGRVLAEVASSSALRKSLIELAASVCGVTARSKSRRRAARRAG